MNIGTADIIEELEEPKRRRSGISGGSGPGNRGGGKDPGGPGSDGPSDKPQPTQFVPEKSRILTAFLLLVVMMTFAGLITAYVFIGANRAPEWRPFDLPIQVWLSTALIIASSLVYHAGKRALDRNDQPSAKKWLIATTIIGAAFISSQLLVWLELVNRGFYMSGNPYAGFFYILTGVHAVHVLGGIAALGSILLRSWHPSNNDAEIAKRQSIGAVVGWYWHFMGMLWIVLLVLLGFWK